MRQAGDMWDFPVMEGVAFRDANRVHPLMQRRVEKLLHELELDCEIDIVTNLSPDNKLYKEIEKTGLLLFER